MRRCIKSFSYIELNIVISSKYICIYRTINLFKKYNICYYYKIYVYFGTDFELISICYL